MGKIFSIGEILIDFIPHQKGSALKDVVSFTRVPGGAPANVAVAVAKFGGTASLITKLREANTGLAFVSLRENGERDFSFYRIPSADPFLEDSEIEADWLKE